MRLAIVADADLKERLRCVRAIAAQTSVSAVGAASWEELEQAVLGLPSVSIVVYAPPLAGAPPDAIARLQALAQRLVIVAAEGMELPEIPPSRNTERLTRPVPEEMLVLLARSAGSQTGRHSVSFAPIDFLQMLCMSGDSHVLIMSREGKDTGVIEVRDGRVWTAFDALGVGEDAFARLVRPEMRARVRPKTPSAKERTIFRDLNELLLDSLRRIDEGSVASPPTLSPEQLEVAFATPEQLATRAKELAAAARRLLMERSYDEAARALVQLSELEPASPLVRANLEQLRKLGYPR